MPSGEPEAETRVSRNWFVLGLFKELLTWLLHRLVNLLAHHSAVVKVLFRVQPRKVASAAF